MNRDMSMIEVMRLTRVGNLGDATNLIRAMLTERGSGAMTAQPRSSETTDLVASRALLSDNTNRDEAGTGQSPSSESGFLERHHIADAGRLGYRLYVPPGNKAALPVVVMLHGCTQTPEDFARGTRMNQLADEIGFLVVYPRQTSSANAQKCWNWFKPGDQQRDRGEPALIAGIVRDVLRDCDADSSRIYIAGLSAGGAAAAILASRYPDMFAAVGIHSGLACGAARDLPSAFAAMGGRYMQLSEEPGPFVPTITFHGDRDSTVAIGNSAHIVASAQKASTESLNTETKTGRTSAGRGFAQACSRDLAGRAMVEEWTIEGAGHAWMGGDAAGSYTDPKGPDASREMVRFFLEHRLLAKII